jgi:hypothetical protein
MLTACALPLLLILSAPDVGPAQSVCPAPQPLDDLPAGWIHLPTHWVDQWHGTYHDAESGAYLDYFVNPQNRRRTTAIRQPGDSIEEGAIGGYHYTELFGPDARSRYERVYAGPEERAPWVQRLLPAKGAALLRIAFAVDHGQWVFEAATYDAEQVARVRSLLLSVARLSTAPKDCDATRGREAVSPEAVEQLPTGAPVTEVIRLLGPADLVVRSGEHGFTLEYAMKSKGRDVGRARLRFDQAQHLVEKRVQ